MVVITYLLIHQPLKRYFHPNHLKTYPELQSIITKNQILASITLKRKKQLRNKLKVILIVSFQVSLTNRPLAIFYKTLLTLTRETKTPTS